MIRATALLSLVLAVSPASAAIRGRVVGGGEAVAGAKITAYAPETYTESIARVLAKKKRAALATTTSAADGTFTLPVDGNGAVLVDVESPRFARSETEELLGDSDVLIGLTAKHPREYTLNGPDGPLAGARVVAFSNVEMETTTGAGGKFTLDRAGGIAILVLHPGIALEPVAPMPNGNVVFAKRAVPLKGKVVDAHGAGVGGARLTLGLLPAGVSAADGTFTIPWAPQERETLVAEAGDLAGWSDATSGTPVIKLAPTARVSGVVRDAEKRPLRGVAVIFGSEKRMIPISTVTDEKGAYAVHVAPGSYQVGANNARMLVDATVDARKATTLDLVATPEAMLTGVVRMASDGKPVAGAQVLLAMNASREESFDSSLERITFASFSTGPDGRFRIAPLAINQPYVVVAYKRGLPPAESAAIQPGKPPRELSIVVGANAREISGTVKDPSGRAIAGVVVTASRAERAVLGAFDDPLVTDAEGRFTALLPQGAWRMEFAKEGYLGRELARVDVKAGAPPLNVELQPASTIRGRVVRKDGNGVAGVMIFEDEGSESAPTAADGSFTLANIGAGEHVLRWMMRSGLRGEQRVTAPAAGVRIVLEDTGTVRGRVVDAAGAPVASFQLLVVKNQAEMLIPQDVADADGRFVWNDAPVGDVTVKVKAQGFVEASQTITVEAGKTAGDLVLTLRRGRAARGKVVSASGEPLEGVRVATGGEEATTDAGGTYELAGLASAQAWLMFLKAGFVPETRRLPAGEADAQFDVQLRPGLTLTGHVLAPNGEPLPGAMVSASTDAPGMSAPATATSDENGAFRLEGLSSSRYTILASTSFLQPGGAEGTVRDVDVERVHDVTIRTKVPEHGVLYGEITGIDPAAKTIAVDAHTAETSERAQSDPSGKYRMENAPVGSVTVQASVGGVGGSRSTRPVVVDVAPNAEVRADLRFPEMFPISGRVLRGGVPMPGASILFEGAGEGTFSATSGEGGAYRTQVTPGRYAIRVGSYSVERDIAGPQTIDINVDLNTVNVTVVDTVSGAAVDHATVSGRDSTTSTHAVAVATTGPNGQAAIDLPRGVSDVVVEKEGYATAAVAADAPSLVVKLTRSDGVVLRVVDARDGRPLSGYAIARDASGRVLASANEAAPDGSIRLPLPPGRYRFSASAHDYGSQTVAADVPGADVQIPLPRGGKLLLTSRADLHADARLLGPGGEEYVRCYCNGLAEIRISGRATLVDSIAPGSYTLEVKQAGAKPRTIPVSVIAEETTAVPLD